MIIVSKPRVKKLFPKRKDWSHKGDFGKLLIIGGSVKYSGSPAFAALAAYRTGVDLVTVAAPERAANIIASFSPDLITYPFKGDFLNSNRIKTLIEMEKHADAVVIGGGLGRKKETMRAVVGFLRKSNRPCVIDADAIHALRGNTKIIRQNWVITPHIMEFKALTDENPRSNVDHRVKLVKYFASRLGATILLKGHSDVISDGKETFLNETGTPYMTKGGTGDVLAGVCGALLAMGVRPIDAACAASYINGAAGQLASKKYGPGMLASDMINLIPEVIR